jgi:hypothetical protein
MTGLVLAAGAVGLAVAGGNARAATKIDAGRGGPLRLHGSNWRLVTPARAAGEAI